MTAGLAAQEAGEVSQATSDYEAALAAVPTDADALYDLGDLEQVDTGNTQAAEAHYRAVLAIDPTFVDALYNLAILETAADPSAASQLYERAVSADPDDAAALLNLGYLLYDRGDRSAGAADIRRAAALDPAYDRDVTALSQSARR